MVGMAYSPVAAGSPGPFDSSTPCGLWRITSSSVALAGTTVMSAPMPGQQAQNVALDAIIDHGGAQGRLGFLAIALVPGPRRLAPFVGLARGDLLGEVEAFQAGKALRLLEQRIAIAASPPPALAITPCGMPFSRIRLVSARVSMPATAGMLCVFSQRSSAGQAAIIGGMLGIGAHDQAAHRRREGLDVFVIGADDADMGKGEGDDLPGIGGIGEDLLIAGHRGVEADLADRRCRPRRSPCLRRRCRRPASRRRAKMRRRGAAWADASVMGGVLGFARK